MIRHLSHNESINIVGTFIDVAQLKAFNTAALPNSAWAYVEDMGEYFYSANSTSAEAIPDVLTPNSGYGRWYKKAISAISDFNLIKQTASSGKLSTSGGTLTGPLTLNANPVSALHAVTKQYVDNLITGITWKNACKAATVANISLSGTPTIDGVALTAGDRVLVKNQSSSIENGIYTVASGSWTRAEDANSNTELETATVFVEQGTVNKNTQWTCTSTNVSIGSSAITFGQISGAGTYTAGTGLQLTGGEFKLDVSYFADGTKAGLLSTTDWTKFNSGFVKGGNAFGTTAALGTTDNNPLQFLTNNLSRMSVSAAGDVQITNTTAASSSTTGALVVGGGIGIGGNSYFTGKTVFSSTNVNPSNRSILQLFSPNTTGTGQTWTVGVGVAGGGPVNGVLVFTSGNANMGGNNVSDVLILDPNGAVTAINGVSTTQLITKGISGTTDVGTGINISKPSNIGSLSATAGTINLVKIGQPISGAASNTQFTPSSGNAIFNSLTFDQILNQTGTANGTIRGIYYNPTITSVLGTHFAFEATSGIVKIGSAVASSSTTTGALQITGGTGIGGALYVGGDIVFSKFNTGNNKILTTDSSGFVSASEEIVPFGVFVQNSTVTVNARGETSIHSGTIVGSTTLNSSAHATNPQLVAGKTFRYKAIGSLTEGSTPDSLRIKVKLGSTVLVDTNAISLTVNSFTGYFEIEFILSVISQGASGTVRVAGSLGIVTNPANFGTRLTQKLSTASNVTIDTTSNKMLDVTIDQQLNGGSSTTGTVEINLVTLEYLN